MSLKDTLQTITRPDEALFSLTQRLAEMPNEEKEMVAMETVAAVRKFNRVLYGGDNVDVASEALEAPADWALQVAEHIHSGADPEEMKQLKPSPELFTSNVYDLRGKSKAQIAVDAQALSYVRDMKKRLQHIDKVHDGTAITIDLRNKTAEEIVTMQHSHNVAALRRQEREKAFANNPVIATLDTVASTNEKILSTTTKAADFAKENPVLTLGGLGTGLMLLNSYGNKTNNRNGNKSMDLATLFKLAIVVVCGTYLAYKKFPEEFTQLTTQLGIGKWFNTPPSSPMWKKEADKSITAPQADDMIAQKQNLQELQKTAHSKAIAPASVSLS